MPFPSHLVFRVNLSNWSPWDISSVLQITFYYLCLGTRQQPQEFLTYCAFQRLADHCPQLHRTVKKLMKTDSGPLACTTSSGGSSLSTVQRLAFSTIGLSVNTSQSHTYSNHISYRIIYTHARHMQVLGPGAVEGRCWVHSDLSPTRVRQDMGLCQQAILLVES